MSLTYEKKLKYALRVWNKYNKTAYILKEDDFYIYSEIRKEYDLHNVGPFLYFDTWIEEKLNNIKREKCKYILR